MRTLIKLLFLIIIVVIIGLIALPFIVDPNDYKQEISSQVEKATGRTLTLDGDIGLSVFPWIALELGPLSLSNAKGFKADTFAKVDAAQIRIKLMPLLKKQLEMDTIVLDGLVLNLEKNKAGKTNWDDLAGSDSDDAPKEETKSNDNSAPALAAVSIAGVKLSNANIVWSDESTGENYQLDNFNLITDPLVPGEPTAVEMDFNVVSAKPQAKAHISLDAKVIVDLENQQYALTGLNFTTQAEGQDLPFSTADVSLNGDVNADMVKQLITIDGLSLTAEVNKDEQNIDANLSADVAVDMQQQTMTLSALVLQVQDLLLNGDIKASKLFSDNPSFAGNIAVIPFNLRQLANKLAIELPPMSDGSTLEFVELKTEFTGSTQHFDAKQLNVTLDQSKLSGQLTINNFAKPTIKFKLALDEIDVDRYLPPVSDEEKQTAAPPATAAAAGASELPLETLRQLNANGTFDIGKLKISGTHSEKIHLEIKSAGGLINLSPISANMYDGQYQGNVSLDARGKTLKLAINENLNDVQVGPLLKDLSGDDKLSGTANAQVKLSGNGLTVDQIKQTLSGNGKFSFTDGALKGVNVAESIRKAKAALTGKKIASSDGPVKTDFSSLTGSFVATNGIVDNQDLQVSSPLLRINGAGLIDIPKEGINYGLKVSIVGSETGQGGVDLSDLKGLTIPVKITGTFNNPKPTVDLASMFKQQATDKVKEQVADKLKDKLGDDLGSLLGSALGAKTDEPSAEDKSNTTTEATKEPEKQEAEPAKSLEDQAKDALNDKLKSFF